MSTGPARPSSATPAGVPAALGAASSAAEDEVVGLCQDLIRIDTSNYGDGSGPGERAAAEHVMALLTDVGLTPELFESEPGRANVVVRLEGVDPSRPALVLHGHLDVVPAHAPDWQVDPFGGELRDGLVWGRGAVDMKDMDAMILAVVRQMVREGRKPSRDVVVAFFADEEAGGAKGARWAVDHRPELFAGATEAISEVGGFSVDLDGRRAYLLQTAEKGIGWLRLVAAGRAGHGSQVNTDNAVTHLAAAVGRIGQHPWPLSLSPTVRTLLQGVADLVGLTFDPEDEHSIDAILAALGSASRFVGATTRNTANPTGLTSGYKANVIPGHAEATVDGRFLPGHEDEFFATLSELIGEGIEVEHLSKQSAVETSYTGDIVTAISRSVLAEDPDAQVVPYLMPGGTDGKHWAKAGIDCFGFAPLRLPADLDFTALFHGVDERVPTDALEFGARVFDRFLDLY